LIEQAHHALVCGVIGWIEFSVALRKRQRTHDVTHFLVTFGDACSEFGRSPTQVFSFCGQLQLQLG
jgi:hypothetical protein